MRALERSPTISDLLLPLRQDVCTPDWKQTIGSAILQPYAPIGRHYDLTGGQITRDTALDQEAPGTGFSPVYAMATTGVAHGRLKHLGCAQLCTERYPFRAKRRVVCAAQVGAAGARPFDDGSCSDA